MGMLFVIDEDMGPSIATTLTKLNHTVMLVVNVFGQGAPDDIVCAYAERVGAVIVTGNAKDYFRLLGREQDGKPGYYKQAGCLALSCGTHEEARPRLLLFRDLWELEAKLCRGKGCNDPRFLVEIGIDGVTVYR